LQPQQLLRVHLPGPRAAFSGKVKKKNKKKSEFDDFFETAPTEAQWLSGVPAVAMDTDAAAPAPAEQPTVAVAGTSPECSNVIYSLIAYVPTTQGRLWTRVKGR
jgi:hypothetical protein